MFGTKVDFKFNLGTEVKDTITGYSGIVIARCQWLHNCNTYGVKSKTLKEGVPIPCEYFDEPSLETISTKKFEEHRGTGGPCPEINRTNRF